MKAIYGSIIMQKNELMKQNYTVSLLVFLSFLMCDFSLMAQSPEEVLFKTYGGGAGKCYGRAMITPQFDTIDEKIVIRPAYSFLKEIPAVYKNETERILVQEAHTRIEVTPAEFSVTVERIKVKDAENYQQAETPLSESDLYDSETVTIEVAPAHQRWEKTKRKKNCKSDNPDNCLEWQLVDVPAQTVKVNKKVRSGKEIPVQTLPTVYKDAEYITVTKKTLKKPASYKEVKVPAQYQTITKRVLVSPRKFERQQVPAEYKTVKKIIQIKEGGFMEAREVLCREEYPKYIRKLQTKLQELGYYSDKIDGRLGKATKTAIIKFQKDKELPIGQLDFSTLKILGLVN